MSEPDEIDQNLKQFAFRVLVWVIVSFVVEELIRSTGSEFPLRSFGVPEYVLYKVLLLLVGFAIWEYYDPSNYAKTDDGSRPTPLGATGSAFIILFFGEVIIGIFVIGAIRWLFNI